MKKFFLVAVCTLVLTAIGYSADHREAPLVQQDPAADINDVYAFVDPNDATQLVLIMTVNPFSVPAVANSVHFSPSVLYQFLIDNNGDALPDHAVQVRFGPRSSTSQALRASFPGGVVVDGQATLPTVNAAANPTIINNGPAGFSVFAGPTDDPFFFDVTGFFRTLAGTGTFTGVDGFAGFNVSSIAVTLPLSAVTGPSPTLQIWGDTSRQKVTVRRAPGRGLISFFGPWETVDRMGVPAVSTALIPSALKDAFNSGRPADDAMNFADDIVATLQALGTTSANIGILASVAVPDTLKLNPSAAPGFPNGRRLQDDVIDTILFFVFNQTATPDNVNQNDRPFRLAFPFLAPPRQAP